MSDTRMHPARIARRVCAHDYWQIPIINLVVM